MLAGHAAIPVIFVCFDLLAEDGESLLGLPCRERRRRLKALDLNGPSWCTTVATDDGASLWDWVCNRGLEGVVAKRVSEPYRPGQRRWLKTKNRGYWRYPFEVEAALSRAR
jgi:bifunctional non-homologous end joining protein LigD